jgi:NAD+ kinase
MTLGVVGDGALADRVHGIADDLDAAVTRGSAGEVLAADPDAVVAVGEASLFALVNEGLDAPVLPIDAGPGYGGVSLADLGPGRAGDLSADGPEPTDRELEPASAAVEALVAGEFGTDSRTVLSVFVGGERVGRALADAMLVTTEPARISEYAIRAGERTVEQFRADGVVVSTPTGSHGYGRSAGGPLLEPGSGVLGVVPIAPFAVNADHWVLSADRPVTLSVERDEGAVSLLLDDRTVREVPTHTPVAVSADGAIPVARVAESRPFFEE